ncbi:YdcH family protein [Thioflexithrix psekupsensis]|uniref:GTP-binding protein n=1 Tax=Thioflexithrix psekupsensis TaxID=1570016 RepID=A0A251X4Z2_9GAMM|nr:DUF465 domain-containing protein [Thioflexithrix psekupsensis]OUD12553.1 hypothetical protein TPSD3_15825 [Thioflexithrix psekupsensis]
MFGEHHEIVKEFPQYRDSIKNLCETDQHFQQMYQEYHELDEEILKIEQNVEPVSDVYAETLKKKRVHLKDQIYHKLVHHSA